MKFQPKDIIALTCILGIGILKAYGFNGTLDGMLGLILGYYFAKRHSGIDKGQ